MCDMVEIDLKIVEDGEPPAKRPALSIKLGAGFKWNLQALANAADAVESGGKSPVSALNELGVRVVYSVQQQGGPAHCPSFTGAVTVADMTFEGWGHSKREARASAARACLAALLARAGRVLAAPGDTAMHDFTSDEPARCPASEFQCLETKMRPPSANANLKPVDASPESVPSPASAASPATALFGATSSPAVHKSPINVLYENYPGLTFNCTFGDGSPLDAVQAPLQLSHSMRFKVVCCIKDQKFEGYGSSKKLAKLAAARSALAVLDEGRVEPTPAAAMAGFLPQTLADHIGKLVNEKFNDVMRGDLVHSKRKVLAGIVITINNRVEDAKVIAVTTGTKCVSGEHMSVRGRALNDTHAEVAARRCLQRHLYSQLLMYASAADPRATIPESDIEPVPGGGYQLKGNRQVHLYVSTAPCGDGRIFSPHEQPEPEPDRHPNRLARGQLRTKIESGEGTIPVKNSNNVVQTWDGVMQGERLLTMSCSDKVARWCVVGLQGALLARLLRPVYLHSLVLGSLLHPHHMYRAICGRIEAYIASIPPPFQLQRPLLARAASTEARTPARAPSFSVCWCSTTPLPEIVNATTGKLESGQPSLLCKQSMFARWQYLVKRLPLLPEETAMGTELVNLPPDLDHLLYNEAKQLCPAYQLAKDRLIEAFEKAKLGRWVKKPLEQDQFVCEILNAEPTALFAWADPGLGYSAVQDPRRGGTVVGNEVMSDDDMSGARNNLHDASYDFVDASNDFVDASNDFVDASNDFDKGNGLRYVNIINDNNFGEIGNDFDESTKMDGCVEFCSNEIDFREFNQDGDLRKIHVRLYSGVNDCSDVNDFNKIDEKMDDYVSYSHFNNFVDLNDDSDKDAETRVKACSKGNNFGNIIDDFNKNNKRWDNWVRLYGNSNVFGDDNGFDKSNNLVKIDDARLYSNSNRLGYINSDVKDNFNKCDDDQYVDVSYKKVNLNCDSKNFDCNIRDDKINLIDNDRKDTSTKVLKEHQSESIVPKSVKTNFLLKKYKDFNNRSNKVYTINKQTHDKEANTSFEDKDSACCNSANYTINDEITKSNRFIDMFDKICVKNNCESCQNTYKSEKENDFTTKIATSIDNTKRSDKFVKIDNTDKTININITISQVDVPSVSVDDFKTDDNETKADESTVNKPSRLDRIRHIMKAGKTSKLAVDKYVNFVNNINNDIESNDDDYKINIKDNEKIENSDASVTKRNHIDNIVNVERISNIYEDDNLLISIDKRGNFDNSSIGCKTAKTNEVNNDKTDEKQQLEINEKYKNIVKNKSIVIENNNNVINTNSLKDLDINTNNDKLRHDITKDFYVTHICKENIDTRDLKHNKHLNYITNKFKNMVINKNTNFVTDTAIIQESNIYARETGKSDSLKSVNKILLYDSKAKSSNIIRPRKFEILRNDSCKQLESEDAVIPNRNKRIDSANELASNDVLQEADDILNINNRDSLKMLRCDTIRVLQESHSNRQNTPIDSCKQLESDFKLQESRSRRGVFLLKKLEVLKKIKDIT